MRHHDSDPRDALNDYLDSLVGQPPADSHAAELDHDLRNDVDAFFALAGEADMTPQADHQRRRPDMNATLPASGALQAPACKTKRKFTLPPWAQHLHLLSTGLLIALVVALSFAAFGPNGIGRNGGGNGIGSGGDGHNNFAAVPIATVPADAETSSVPYPTADECTVERPTREELIKEIQEANTATEPTYQKYERSIRASDEDAQAIMQTFREWQACGVRGKGPAYMMQLETSWYTANQLPVFYDYQNDRIDRPISEEQIEHYADVLLTEEENVGSPVPAFGTPVPAIGPPVASSSPPKRLPIPEGATPATSPYGGNGVPTIFPENITMNGPNIAHVTVYFVVPKTGQVVTTTPLIYGFVKVDGQWLLNTYNEGNRG